MQANRVPRALVSNVPYRLRKVQSQQKAETVWGTETGDGIEAILTLRENRFGEPRIEVN